MTWTLKALQGLSFVLIVILIAIIIIGIMNTMWIAIRERTREIGTLRAIGMQRREVLWMFLLESLMLGLFATVAGAGGGRGDRGRASTRRTSRCRSGLQFFLMSPITCTCRCTARCWSSSVVHHHRRDRPGRPLPVVPRGAPAPGRRHVPLRMNAHESMTNRTRSLAFAVAAAGARLSALAGGARSPR